jgi:hypothetical protein
MSEIAEEKKDSSIRINFQFSRLEIKSDLREEVLRSFRDTVNLIDLNCSSRTAAPISKSHISALFHKLETLDLTPKDV